MAEDILEKIVAPLKESLAAEKVRFPQPELEKLCDKLPENRRSFKRSITRNSGRIRVIAELKKASPSKGVIRLDLPVSKLACELEQSGAAALSVLTETNFFLGCRENLMTAYAATEHIPVLRKDFIVDEYQIFQAKLWGASAVLLIAALLPEPELKAYIGLAHGLGMDALCEAHNMQEVEKLLSCGADIVGVNARNLRDFSTSAAGAAAIIEQLPAGVVKVAESAIITSGDLANAEAAGADAALIGEALMRYPHPGERLKELYGD